MSAVTLISTATPTGSASSLEFTSIPSSYDDLLMIGNVKGDSGTDWAPNDSGNYLRLNDLSTSTSYEATQLYDQYSSGTFVGYQNQKTGTGNAVDYIKFWGITGTLNSETTPGAVWMYIPGYSVTTDTPTRNFMLHTGAVSNSTNVLSVNVINAGAVNTTSAINKISYYSGVGNLVATAKMSLYGISNS